MFDFRDVVAVASDSFHTLVLHSDGTVSGWGNNRSGELGDGTTVDRTIPTTVQGLKGVTAIAVGSSFSLAQRNDGSVWEWGKELGFDHSDAAAARQLVVPILVGGLSGVKSISAKWRYAMVLREDGSVWAWGGNEHGQLGDGTTDDRRVPVRVRGLSSVAAVAAEGYSSLALRNGVVWAWGDNKSGQLGDGTLTSRQVPVRVSALDDVTAIAGSGHSLALRRDGTVWAWGANSGGQLGNDRLSDSPIPTQVSGLSGVSAIAASTFHSVALKRDGTVWVWGQNFNGALGSPLADSVSRHPIQVGGLAHVIAIAADDHGGLALVPAAPPSPSLSPSPRRSPTGPLPADFLGYWDGHGRHLTVNDDGTAVMTYRTDQAAGPINDGRDDIIFLFASKNVASGLIVKSTSPQLVGSTVTLTLYSDHTAVLRQAMQPDVTWKFCGTGAPAGACGA